MGAGGSMNELAKGWWEAAEVKAEVEAVVVQGREGEGFLNVGVAEY